MPVHALPRILAVEVVSPHVLRLEFTDGTIRTIDLAPMLRGPLYGALADFDQFKLVTIDPIAGTVMWPNGADFDPETLYHWPNYREQLFTRARSW